MINKSSLPDNVYQWLKENHRDEMFKGALKLSSLLKKVDPRLKIVGGTAIGKHYDTLICDITYQGSEFSINEYGDISDKNSNPIVTPNDIRKLLGLNTRTQGVQLRPTTKFKY